MWQGGHPWVSKGELPAVIWYLYQIQLKVKVRIDKAGCIAMRAQWSERGLSSCIGPSRSWDPLGYGTSRLWIPLKLYPHICVLDFSIYRKFPSICPSPNFPPVFLCPSNLFFSFHQCTPYICLDAKPILQRLFQWNSNKGHLFSFVFFKGELRSSELTHERGNTPHPTLTLLGMNKAES